MSADLLKVWRPDLLKVWRLWRRRYPEATLGSAQIKKYTAATPPGDTCTQLLVRGELVMSDTRDELRDHYTAIYRAKGRVLINGLGLGCYLAVVLSKPEVTHVDVVELNPDVLALVAPHFTKDERVVFHQADAYVQARKWPPGTRWDCVWHDIWPTKCSDDLEGHARLRRSYARRAEWQGSWAHETLVYLRERGA